MGQYVALSAVEKRFVYGTMRWPQRGGLPRLPGWQSRDSVAIEILREYSANELLGKLYIIGAGGDWTQASFPALERLEWYQFYVKLPQKALDAGFIAFYMEGSGAWKILHFRAESDATGPYVAAALQYMGKPARTAS